MYKSTFDKRTARGYNGKIKDQTVLKATLDFYIEARGDNSLTVVRKRLKNLDHYLQSVERLELKNKKENKYEGKDPKDDREVKVTPTSNKIKRTLGFKLVSRSKEKREINYMFDLKGANDYFLNGDKK